MFLVSIILPCYNESLSLTTLHKKALFLTENYDIEIIFLDNGSTDDSWNVMNSLENSKKIRFIRIQKNKGYGYGIKHALGFCNGKYIGWTHADLQTDLFDLIKAYDLISKIVKTNKNSNKYVFKGKRVGRRNLDNLISYGMSIMARFVFFSNKFFEINAQPSIYDKSIIKSLMNAPNDYNFDLGAFVIANAKNYTFVRFLVLFPERKYGESHWNKNLMSKIKFIIKTLFELLSIKFNNKFIN